MTADHAPSPPAISATPTTRWESEYTGAAWDGYVRRLQRMVDNGTDLDGEARFLDAMADRNATILDAGCGAGRVAAGLAARGHRAVGVDKDPALIRRGTTMFPGVNLLAADLLTLTANELETAGAPSSFDIVALPGNVMVFLAPGTEKAVLDNLFSLLKPGGRLVTGFATDRDFTVADLDLIAPAVGLALTARFGTWQLEPYTAASSWAVTVLERTAGSGER